MEMETGIEPAFPTRLDGSKMAPVCVIAPEQTGEANRQR